MNKRIWALLFVLMMILSMGSVAMAEGEAAAGGVTLTKQLTIDNVDGVASIDTTDVSFTFRFKAEKDTDATNKDLAILYNSNVPAEAYNYPELFTGEQVVTIGGAFDYTNGTTYKGTTTVLTQEKLEEKFANIPYGAYWYKISEVSRPDQEYLGVTYSKEELRLRVVVYEGENGNKIVKAAFLTGTDGELTKMANPAIVNTYQLGQLVIEKKITGNASNPEDAFKVQVQLEDKDITGDRTLVCPKITIVNSPTDENNEDMNKSLTDFAKIDTRDIWVKNGTKITIDHIPYGLTFTVSEINEETNGYVATYEQMGMTATGEDADAMVKGVMGKADQQKFNVTITNTREIEDIDTGVSLDNLPYILLLGVALAGILIFVIKRRTAEE